MLCGYHTLINQTTIFLIAKNYSSFFTPGGRSRPRRGLLDPWAVASPVLSEEVPFSITDIIFYPCYLSVFRILKTTLACLYIAGAESPGVDANGNSFDFTTKLLHLAWHPSENSIACAAANSLYMYYA